MPKIYINPDWVAARYSLALLDSDNKIFESNIGPVCHMRFDEENLQVVLKALQEMDWGILQRLSIKPYIEK